MSVEPERQRIVVIAPHPELGMLRDPAQAFDGLWAVAQHVTAEGHRVARSLVVQDRFQRGPVGVNECPTVSTASLSTSGEDKWDITDIVRMRGEGASRTCR
jgi:hypothetical protein